ncbi:MAG: DinB family protein [Anaerolineae bacterium]|nr:DinB family protein [Anaerolineae bacterium]
MSIFSSDRCLMWLRKTPVLLNALLKDVTDAQAHQLTDGPNGWTVTEAMCHMRDLEVLTLKRVEAILTLDHPMLPSIDLVELPKQRDYPHQDFRAEFSAYVTMRKELVQRLSSVDEALWTRSGTHATYGEMTLYDLAAHVTLHDVNHIEQITRTLKLSDAIV